MTHSERKSLVQSYLGKTVDIVIDRPIGYIHKKEDRTLTYPINYGYIPGVLGGDGEELDVYLLGVDQPLTDCTCRIIGIVYREDDVEDKLIAAPEGMIFYQNEIAEAIHFQEQYYKTTVESLYEKSCGTVLYTVIGGERRYVLVKASERNCGFPKGHVDPFETEIEAALRETWEETSIRARIVGDFARERSYELKGNKTKSVTYFLAKFENQMPKYNPGYEYRDLLLLPFPKAMATLSHEQNKEVLAEAEDYIQKYVL